jgi:hypothetical protein
VAESVVDLTATAKTFRARPFQSLPDPVALHALSNCGMLVHCGLLDGGVIVVVAGTGLWSMDAIVSSVAMWPRFASFYQ